MIIMTKHLLLGASGRQDLDIGGRAVRPSDCEESLSLRLWEAVRISSDIMAVMISRGRTVISQLVSRRMVN